MWWSIIGIIIVFLGTAFSLWSIITNDTKKAGTWEGINNRGLDAKKEKINVIFGIVLILVGSIFQIVGAVFS